MKQTKLNKVDNKKKSSKKKGKMKVFDIHPKVLCSEKHNLVLMFSPKSGCTFAVKWFFYQINHLDAALAYRPWIHKYRAEVFYEGLEYMQGVRKIANGETQDLNIVKFVRNPFTRAVSSYIHCLVMIKEGHVGAIRFITNLKTSELKPKYSFKEFMDRVEDTKNRRRNGHWRTQLHPLETRGLMLPKYIIKLEESDKSLVELEKQLKLKTSDISTLSSSRHHTISENEIDKKAFFGETPFNVNVRKNRPDYKQFYNKELEKQVVKIYKEDFEAYGYDTKFL